MLLCWQHASSRSDPEQHTVEASRGRAWCVWSTREDERLRRSSVMFTPALHCRGLWWSTEHEKTSKREREEEKGVSLPPEGFISWGLQQHAGFQYTLPFDVPVIKEKKCQLSQKVITLICTTCNAENCTRTIYTHTFTPQQAFFPSLSKILPTTPGTGSYASTFHPFLHFLISIFLHHWWST